MTDIREKYVEYRKQAKDGDIMLWHGNGLMARIIRACDTWYLNDDGEKVKDRAYYTHASVVLWGRGERLQNADSWSNGVDIVPLSDRIAFYNDFCVLRPKMNHVLSADDQMKVGINFIMDKWQEVIKYDYLLLPRIALIKKMGIDITALGKKQKVICSEFTRDFTFSLAIKDYYRRELFTPQDHIRFNAGSFEVLFDNKLMKK